MPASTPIQLGLACLFLLQAVFAAPSEIGVIPDIFELASEDSPGISKSDLYHVSQVPRATCCANSLQGEVFFSQELISTIKRKVGIFSARHPKKEQEQSGAFVATRLLADTSPVHADHHKASGQLIGEHKEIGFVILNSNPDAYFKYGDSEIPIVENTLVHFKGRYPHNTVINSGEVNLLGPFEIFSAWGTSTKKFVVGNNPCECMNTVCNDEYYIGERLVAHDGENGRCKEGFEEVQSEADCEGALNDMNNCFEGDNAIGTLTFKLGVTNPMDGFEYTRGCTVNSVGGGSLLTWKPDGGSDEKERFYFYPICKKKAGKSGKKIKKDKKSKAL